jgi:hypothetical protein
MGVAVNFMRAGFVSDPMMKSVQLCLLLGSELVKKGLVTTRTRFYPQQWLLCHRKFLGALLALVRVRVRLVTTHTHDTEKANSSTDGHV